MSRASGTFILMVALNVMMVPASASPTASGEVTRTLNWENGADRSLPGAAPKGFGKQSAAGKGPVLVNSPVRDGSWAVKFQLDAADPAVSGGKRNEITQPDAQPSDAERWYGFSVNLPADWARDKSAEIVSQWHSCDSGCPGLVPPLSLQTWAGRWRVYVNGEMIVLDPYATGSWTDWVFHVKWRTGGTGLVEVWRDGKPVISRTGPTYLGGPRSPYFKFGLYKADWNNGRPTSTRRRVMYYDALRLGGRNAGYAAVSPGARLAPGGIPAPTPSRSGPKPTTTKATNPAPVTTAPTTAPTKAPAATGANPAPAPNPTRSAPPTAGPSPSKSKAGRLATTGSSPLPGIIGTVLVLTGGVFLAVRRRHRRG